MLKATENKHLFRREVGEVEEREQRGFAVMEDFVVRLVLLPHSLLCASVGAVLGGWLGSFGIPIDGESHIFLRGAFRGAKAFGFSGWTLPETILRQASLDARLDPRNPGRFIVPSTALLRNPVQLQLDLPHLQQFSSKLHAIRNQNKEDVKKLKDICEFHQRRAEEATLAAAVAKARATQLESMLEMEEVLMQKQLLAMSRSRSSRSARSKTKQRFETGGPIVEESQNSSNLTPQVSYEDKIEKIFNHQVSFGDQIMKNFDNFSPQVSLGDKDLREVENGN